MRAQTQIARTRPTRPAWPPLILNTYTHTESGPSLGPYTKIAILLCYSGVSGDRHGYGYGYAYVLCTETRKIGCPPPHTVSECCPGEGGGETHRTQPHPHRARPGLACGHKTLSATERMQCKYVRTYDGRTDGRTDRRTDRQTDGRERKKVRANTQSIK